jgi:cytidine deaminase
MSLFTGELRVETNQGRPTDSRLLFDDTRLKELIALAKAASKRAYCPYSRFEVGAVAVSESGESFSASNVENAAYGLSMCADRNAVLRMVCAGHQRLAAVVIYTPTQTPSAPCGACRQVLSEFGRDALVFCACDGPEILRRSVSQLLPDAFGAANLV